MVFSHGMLDDGFQIPVVEVDGILHLVGRAPAKAHAKVFGISSEAAKELVRALKGDHHHVAIRNAPRHPHHGILIPFVPVQGNQ